MKIFSIKFWVTSIKLLVASSLAWFFFELVQTFLVPVHRINHDFPVVWYWQHASEVQIKWQSSRPKDWVLAEDLPITVGGAMIVSEDSLFYSHKGFDVEALRKAWLDNWKAKAWVRGASTISQQLVKNVYLHARKTPWRKLREAILTWKLERSVDKERILEVYLNVVHLGQGLYGVGPAARFYFGKPATQLEPQQAAFLAMLLPNPVRYSLSYRQKKLSPYAHRTIQTILTRMGQSGYLGLSSLEKARSAPLGFRSSQVLFKP